MADLLTEARQRAGIRVGQWPELVRELCDMLENEQRTRDKMRRQMAEALLAAARERDKLLEEGKLGLMIQACPNPDCSVQQLGTGYSECPGCGAALHQQTSGERE